MQLNIMIEGMFMGFAAINDYINSLDENGKRCVDGFVAFMEAEFPNITPQICFAMPMWWAGAKMYDGYVAVSAAKKHYSVHFHDEKYLSDLKKSLPNCGFGRKCINIKYGDEQSFSVVKRNIKGYFNSIL
jgi:uncharacterized protein YdhG (YjbR/CyaY superfamily)